MKKSQELAGINKVIVKKPITRIAPKDSELQKAEDTIFEKAESKYGVGKRKQLVTVTTKTGKTFQRNQEVGTIVNGFKKMNQGGQWQKVSSHGLTKKEHEVEASNYKKENAKKYHPQNVESANKHEEEAKKLDDRKYGYSDVQAAGSDDNKLTAEERAALKAKREDDSNTKSGFQISDKRSEELDKKDAKKILTSVKKQAKYVPASPTKLSDMDNETLLNKKATYTAIAKKRDLTEIQQANLDKITKEIEKRQSTHSNGKMYKISGTVAGSDYKFLEGKTIVVNSVENGKVKYDIIGEDGKKDLRFPNKTISENALGKKYFKEIQSTPKTPESTTTTDYGKVADIMALTPQEIKNLDLKTTLVYEDKLLTESTNVFNKLIVMRGSEVGTPEYKELKRKGDRIEDQKYILNHQRRDLLERSDNKPTTTQQVEVPVSKSPANPGEKVEKVTLQVSKKDGGKYAKSGKKFLEHGDFKTGDTVHFDVKGQTISGTFKHKNVNIHSPNGYLVIRGDDGKLYERKPEFVSANSKDVKRPTIGGKKVASKNK